MTQAQLLAEVRKEQEKISLAKTAPKNYEILICSQDVESSPSVTTSVSRSKVAYISPYLSKPSLLTLKSMRPS